MSKNLLTFGLGLALSGLMVCVSSAELTSLKRLPGHVPSLVSQLSSVGTLPANTNLQLAIGLPLRNREALTNLLHSLYDPASPNYHHYLTADEFSAQFGPTKQDYQAVMDFARTNGFHVIGTHPNRMLLDVRASASDAERAFHVSFMRYHHPTEARDFYAPDVEPSVPTALPIQDIGGLDNLRRPYSKRRSASELGPVSSLGRVTSKTQSSKAGSGPANSYLGNDFRTAYVPGATLNGSGQTIALVQFDGYLASDIAIYESLAGLTNVPLQNVLIDGFSGAPTGNGGETEVSLDIEMCVSMAPALAKVILYEGDPFNSSPNDVLNAIATDNSARQISSSWGWGGGPSATTDQIFQEMAVQGQTYFNASGDSCAFTAGVNSVNGVDNPFTPNAPSDSPYITQVGGTTLTMRGAGAGYASETVWNWGISRGSAFDGEGSSGGVSGFYPIPDWQTNAISLASQGSTINRNTPDVAMTADNVFIVSDGGLGFIEGGTSCAAPLWAGYMALANQAAANNGHSSLGFINPALYSIASGTSYASCFHDITTGNNEWSGSPGLFTAVANYDLCTGLGTPNGINLINALLNFVNPITHISPPPKPYGTNLMVMNGSNPNGNWELFVQDDTQPDAGVISNGWILNLTTANPVGYAADQGVTLAASVSSVLVGGSFTYSLTVTNYGPSISSNSIVTEPLPDGITMLSSNVTLGSVIRNGSTLIWEAGTLTPGTGGALTLNVQANSPGNAVNTITVSADTSDPNPYDDSASVGVTVGMVTPPMLSASAINSGHTFQFSITSGVGTTNIVQVSTNLSNPNGWTPIYTNSGSFLFVDTKSTNYPVRFYRDLMIGP
jgi:uncharacterized repeat protein (TIGR01451 family)